ncbi:MAG: hypothetical protein OEZ34_10355 [Spirochaetia bacterium]|nr:hypothetical protein [Spirochaetia bacterium]
MKITNTSLLSGLPKPLHQNILKVARILNRSGFQCFIVGGAVRDLLMGRPSKDFDFTTDARPGDIISLFNKTIPTGIKHGTVTVLLHKDVFEITTFRSDGKYSDARHPDSVSFSDTLNEDLLRRDFTMNGIAYDPLENILIDNHGGIDDIKNRIIQTIGRAEERFLEDGLRTIRACRFSATLEFEISEDTFHAMKDRKVHERTKQIAVERFTDEIFKGLSHEKISRMISSLEESGLISLFIPEYPDKNMTEEKLLKLDRLFSLPETFKIAKWFSIVNLDQKARSIASRLKFSGKNIKEIETFLNIIRFSEPQSDLFKIRKFSSLIKGQYGENSLPLIQSISDYSSVNPNIKKIIHSLSSDPLVIKDLAVNGTDLINEGYRGKEIGNQFNEILEIVWKSPEKNQKEILLKVIKKTES